MKVVILAGGFGTRFGNQTEYVPKPMIRIGSHPMLWHIMKLYMFHGFNEFVLCLGYKGDMIKEYFLNYPFYNNDFTMTYREGEGVALEPHVRGRGDQIKVTLVHTGLKTKTGGRLKRVQEYIDTDDFLMTYGDGVADVNIGELVQFHQKNKKIATLTGVYSPGRFGNLLLNGSRVEKFAEKTREEDHLINGGFYVFNRKVFDYLDGDGCSLEEEPLEKLSSQGELMCFSHHRFWQCMDTMRDLELLNRLWHDRQAPWKVWS